MSCEQWFWLSPLGGDPIELTRWTNNTEVVRAGMTGRWHPKPVITRAVIPNRAGQYTQNRRHEYRSFTLPLAAVTSELDDLQATLYELAQNMDPMDGPGVLRYVGTDGRVTELTAVQTADFDPNDWVGSSPGFAAQTMVLTFEADEPYFLGDEANFAWTGSDPYPWFGIGASGAWVPITLGGSSVLGDVFIVTGSDAPTWPIWDIVGPGADPSLTNVTTGKTLALTGVSLAAGDVLHLDLSEGVKTITGPDGSNWFPYLTEDSLWPLVKGTNELVLSLSGSTSASYIAVRFRPRRIAP